MQIALSNPKVLVKNNVFVTKRYKIKVFKHLPVAGFRKKFINFIR